MYQVLFTNLASKEYTDAYQYYQKTREGLGEVLEHELDLVIHQLSKNPINYQRKFKFYREALLNKFPYFFGLRNY